MHLILMCIPPSPGGHCWGAVRAKNVTKKSDTNRLNELSLHFLLQLKVYSIGALTKKNIYIIRYLF